MSSQTPDRFLNYAQVAELLGLDEGTVRNGECQTSEIPRIKLGRRVVFSFHAVQAWMAQKAREAEEAQRRSDMRVVDLVAEKSRRRRAVENTMKTIINGGRYK